jgi:flagellar M-ring protein FliF
MSNVVVSFWSSAGRGAKVAAIGAAVLLVALVIWGAFVAFHEEYRVLFAELSAPDAGAIVERLKQDKVPYRIGGNGTAISVPAERVHEVRLRLMTSDLPLSGGVGFEIFDNQGLGTTEHSQRVSFQRALQGELARTIGALDQVKQVRVHLVLPETTLFSRDRQQATAAVNLIMQPGATLSREQTVGMQRLVAAAVPGLEPGRVIISDQRGVTLSSGDATSGAGAVDARLQVKRDIEEYVTHKIAHLLDSAYGAGQAIVSVDTTLNFDATKTTVQDLLPAGDSNNAGEGRLIRKRQVVAGTTNESVWTAADTTAAPVKQPSSSVELEYEYGKRIAEVIAAPGAVTRISVGVIVPGALTEEKRQRISELVRMAAGINESRGDAVSVQALEQVSSGATPNEAVFHGEEVEADAVSASPVNPTSRTPWWQQLQVVGPIVLAFMLILALMWAFAARGPRRLSEMDRQRILDEIKRALGDEAKAAGGRVR